MMKCTIAHVEEDWNMCLKHELREGKHAKRLKHGECIVALNRRLDMCRVIDFVGMVHDGYAPPGEKFSVELVIQMMKDGMGIDLHVPRAVHARLAA